jgi:hypothetical protein
VREARFKRGRKRDRRPRYLKKRSRHMKVIKSFYYMGRQKKDVHFDSKVSDIQTVEKHER